MTKQNKKDLIVPTTPTFDLDQFKTKSDKIRYLSSQGQTRSQIATMLNIRYQHVRNVLTQPLKKK